MASGAPGTRLFQYRVVPMGCAISTSVLQSALMKALQDFYFKTVIVYCEDILIYTAGGLEKHIHEVKRIVAAMDAIKAKVKLAKVEIVLNRVTLLGMYLSASVWQIARKFRDKFL